MDSSINVKLRFIAVIIVVLVPVVLSNPVSQPIYPNNQYVSGQIVPAIQLKPQAQGYLQPQQAAVQPGRAVYEQQTREGLQHYSSKVRQPLQQVLLATNIDRQRVPQVAGPLYLHQIQTSQQGHAAAVALAAQRKAAAATQAIQRPILVQQQQPQPQQQYLREQPQIKYVSRPIPHQYRQQQQHQHQQQQREQQAEHQDREEKEPEDYDPNPQYQFGFDVNDDLYTNYQNRKEQREGNKITGSYSVVDSDGFIRTVTYTADPKEGFKAQVTRQPTDIVVKIPKPDPQFQRPTKQQYVPQQKPPQSRGSQDERQNVVYQYEE